MTKKYPEFPSDCKSLLSKHLNQNTYDKLNEKKTNNGFTLDDAIRSGVENTDSGIGVYAGDTDSYEVFSTLLDPIISEYHDFERTDKHKSDLNPDNLNAPNPDPNGTYILSTRIRVGRNIADIPLGTAISKEQRFKIQFDVSSALNRLNGELSGDYYPLDNMSESTKQQLIEDHFLFKAGDRFLQSAGLNRDWPSGRGIYHNNDKTFLVWVNEEDHLRIISMQKGADILEVFTRLTDAVSQIEKSMPFSYSNRLGYITSCPSNLGTAMRASVHIKLPKLANDMDKFKEICEKHHLQIRGIHGEHSQSEGAVYDISNKRRLGVTEVECVQDMYDGIVQLIRTEESL